MTDQGSIFISYNRKDADTALRLATDLKAQGQRIWIDQQDIPAGARWDDEIEKALTIANTLLVVMSRAGVESQNLQDEVAYAIDRKKRIIPVLIEQCEVPLRLVRFHYIDFTHGYPKAFELLLSELTGSHAKVVADPLRPQRHTFKIAIWITAATAGLLILSLLLRDKPQKDDVGPEPPRAADTNVRVEPQQIATIRQDLDSTITGDWVGQLDEKSLVIRITSYENGMVKGIDIAGSNERPFTGTCTVLTEKAFHLVLAEPGDHKWDGEFSIDFRNQRTQWTGTGTFKSYDGKINRIVKVRKPL